MNVRHTSHRDWAILTILVVSGGMGWLVLENHLRGGMMSPRIGVGIVVSLAGVGALMGLSMRPRETVRGEAWVNLELLQLALLAIFAPGALGLVVYALTYGSSIVAVAACWLFWIIVLLLALVLQLLVYAAAIGSVVAGFLASDGSGEPWIGVVVTLVGVVLLALVTHRVTASLDSHWLDAFNGHVVVAARQWTGWIPEWGFLFDFMRGTIARANHHAIFSAMCTAGLGVTLAFTAALSSRWARLAMMRLLWLRPFLPSASAPLPDGVSVLDERQSIPATAWLMLVWSATLATVIVSTWGEA